MCGISGFIDIDNVIDTPDLVLKSMTDSLYHRGPDSAGYWVSPDKRIGLGHRRLSILDLTATGHQPMTSISDRYIIVFNGEIYNFQSLKTELVDLGYTFKGHSDTEILLALVEELGFEEAIKKTEGMFAIALYDMQDNTVHFARDRLGEKPLYVGIVGSMVVFSSELKSFKAVPNWATKISKQSISAYFTYGFIPTPHSIYENVIKVSPGTIVSVNTDSPTQLCELEHKTYWSLEDTITKQNSHATTIEDASDKLDTLLKSVIKDQLVADVPVGMFLSGGIDSSAIVALAQSCSEKKVKTFSIGFEEEAFNEAPFAREVAQTLDTDHTELYCSPDMAKATVEKITKHYDEPFSDASQIPTLVLCELTRKHVTVCLSGDGGDELFHGYSRYFRTQDKFNKIKSIPAPIRSLLLATGKLFKLETSHRSYVKKLARFLEALRLIETPALFYQSFVSRGAYIKSLVRDYTAPSFPEMAQPTGMDIEKTMRFCDINQYLRDDILVKVDLASMAASLEVRVPMLNHKVVEFAWSLPNKVLRKNGKGKTPLRVLLSRYLPGIDFERPKKGFAVPLEEWLRNDLKAWASDLIFNNIELYKDYVNETSVEQIWRHHQEEQADYSCELWDIIIFILWLKNENIDTKPTH